MRYRVMHVIASSTRCVYHWFLGYSVGPIAHSWVIFGRGAFLGQTGQCNTWCSAAAAHYGLFVFLSQMHLIPCSNSIEHIRIQSKSYTCCAEEKWLDFGDECRTGSGIGKVAEIPVTIIMKDHVTRLKLLESGFKKISGALQSTLSVLCLLIC